MSSVCRADSFTFTPTGGAATTFDIDPGTASDASEVGFGYSGVTMFSGGVSSINTEVFFFDPEHVPGSFDFFINDPLVGVVAYFTGPKLYDGFPGPITFLGGTYQLQASSYYGDTVTGTLVVAPSTVPTPEPRSWVLLATGLIASAGLFKARLIY